MKTSKLTKRLLSFTLTVAMVLALLPAATLTALADDADALVLAINAYSDANKGGDHGFMAVKTDANTVTVTNKTSGGSGGVSANPGITSTANHLPLDITADVTVVWDATISGAQEGYSLIWLTGDGTFKVAAGGLVHFTGTVGGAIFSPEQAHPAIVVDGGTVKANRSGGIETRGANASVTVKSGLVTNLGNNVAAISMTGANATVTVEGGTVEVGTNGSRAIHTTGAGSVVKVSGGNVSANAFGGYAVRVEGANSAVYISDGILSANDTFCYAVYVSGANTAVAISGGTLTQPSGGAGRAVYFTDTATAGTLYYGGTATIVGGGSLDTAGGTQGFYTGNNAGKFNPSVFTDGANLFKLDAKPKLTQDTVDGAAYIYDAGSAHTGMVVAALPDVLSGRFTLTSMAVNGLSSGFTVDESAGDVTFYSAPDTGATGLTLTLAGTLAEGRITVSAFPTAAFGVNLSPAAQIIVSSTGLGSLKVGQAVTGSVTYTLLSGTYTDPIDLADFAVSGLPDGLSAGPAVRTSATVVTVPITGTPTTYNANPTSITLPPDIPAANVSGAAMAISYTGAATASSVAKGEGAPVSDRPYSYGTPSASSITVKAVTNAGTTGQTVEYAISTDGDITPTSGWQAGTAFSGLSAGTNYCVYARTAESANYNAGPAQRSQWLKTATSIVTVDIPNIAGVTSPVVGAAPVTTISETPQYTGTVSWDPSHATFAHDTVYTATISLIAKEGYMLMGVTADYFTVAGATSVTHAADSGVITAVFPATAAAIPQTITAATYSTAPYSVGNQISATKGTYTANDGGAEGTHTYKWYRDDDGSGANATEIAGATTLAYTPVTADFDKYICVETTPVGAAGMPGTPVKSAYIRIGVKLIAAVSGGDGGTATVDGQAEAVVYNPGGYTVSVNKNTPSNSVQWTAGPNVGSFNDPTFDTTAYSPPTDPSGDITLTAMLASTLIVSFSVTGDNGDLSAKAEDVPITSGTYVTGGQSVVFTAAPHPGYHVKEWRDNGNPVNGTNLTYTLGNITAAHTVTVEFEPNTATLTVRKDGASWNNHGRTFTLKLSTDESITYNMSNVGDTATAAVPNGLWKVYDDLGYTGFTITINNGNANETIDYYTVSYAVIDAGNAQSSIISASANGSPISTGAAVPGGRSLTITATGAGATTYTYAWSGAGTSGQTTNTLTMTVDQAVNATCTVTGVDSGVRVTGIAIKTQPTKLTYTEGETLDLTGLAVTLSFSDASTQDVGYADFGTYGVAMNYTPGDTLTAAWHDGQTIVLICNTWSAQTDALTVNAAQPASYTVTFMNGSAVHATKTVTLPATMVDALPAQPTNGSYTFGGWYTSTNGNGTQFTASTTVAADITVYAYWTGGGNTGGTGGGGGSSTTTTTVPAANGAVQVNYSQSGGTVTLTLPDSKITEIIGKSTTKALLDLSGLKNATTATLPKSSLTAFANEGLGVEISLPEGTVTLSGEAAKSVAQQASGTNISVELNQVSTSALTAVQQESVKAGDTVIDINILSGSQKISAFDGEFTVTVPYTGALPVAVWYLNDAGELEKLDCTYDAATKSVSFTLSHLSLYVLGQDTDVSAWNNPFSDVKESDWFYKSVEYAVTNGLFSGTSATTFSPNTTMTRGMMVTVLWRMAGSPSTGSAAFTDVAADAYYSAAVAWAAENGIVNGTGNNRFAPDENITREQMAVMLYNYAVAMDIKLPETRAGDFADEDQISAWAKDAVNAMYAAEILNGKGSDNFDPQGNATRAEVATMFMNFIEAAK